MDEELDEQLMHAVDDGMRAVIADMLRDKPFDEIVDIVFRMRTELVAANETVDSLTELLEALS